MNLKLSYYSRLSFIESLFLKYPHDLGCLSPVLASFSLFFDWTTFHHYLGAWNRLCYPSLSDNNTRNVLQSPRENQVLDIKLTYCHPLPSFPGDQKYVTHIQWKCHLLDKRHIWKRNKHRLRAHPQVSGYFWKRIFFLHFTAFCSHVNGVFGPPTRRFLKTFPRVKIFENTGFSFKCGRTKTEFKNTTMSYIIKRTLCKRLYRIYIVLVLLCGWAKTI